jgi:Tfp pilus assembly protein PilZ
MKNYTKNKHKDKREFKRLETSLQISLFYGNMVYSGMVSNLSESGMFISTKRLLPVDTMLVTSLMIDEKPIQIPIQIRRAVSPSNALDKAENGVGVHILRSSRDYLNFLGKYRSQQLKLTL